MNFINRRIIFRADGNSQIGLGHVIRSLSLVEMLSADFTCLFAIKEPGEKIRQLIGPYCAIESLPSFTSIDDEIACLKKIVNKNDILVLDGYQFGSDYQKQMKPIVHKLVAIDDYAAIHFYADLVINHGYSSAVHGYETEPYTRLLTGWPYLLMRKPFRLAAQKQREITKIATLFICMGGADPFNITNKAFKAALQCSFIEQLIIVTGSAYSYQEELEQLIASCTKKVIHAQNVQAGELVELIRACDIAVCPSSSVALEVCCVKAGLLTGTVIDNQALIHRQLTESGCCISLGDLNQVAISEIVTYLQKMNNLDLVKTMTADQARAIDGLSGERILQEFKMLNVC